MNNLYKEYFDCASEQEAHERWLELNHKGYHGSEIYRFNYQGKDGKFHREVFVFNKEAV